MKKNYDMDSDSIFMLASVATFGMVSLGIVLLVALCVLSR